MDWFYFGFVQSLKQCFALTLPDIIASASARALFTSVNCVTNNCPYGVIWIIFKASESAKPNNDSVSPATI